MAEPRNITNTHQDFVPRFPTAVFQDDGDCPKDKLLQAAETLINFDGLPCEKKTVGVVLEDAPRLPVEKGKIDTIHLPTSIYTDTVKDMSVQTSVFL